MWRPIFYKLIICIAILGLLAFIMRPAAKPIGPPVGWPSAPSSPPSICSESQRQLFRQKTGFGHCYRLAGGRAWRKSPCSQSIQECWRPRKLKKVLSQEFSIDMFVCLSLAAYVDYFFLICSNNIDCVNERRHTFVFYYPRAIINHKEEPALCFRAYIEKAAHEG